MKRNTLLVLALLLTTSAAAPLTYLWVSDAPATGPAATTGTGTEAGATGPGGVDPLNPLALAFNGAYGGKFGNLHDRLPKSLNETPYIPFWHVPTDSAPAPLGPIFTYERKQAEAAQNQTRRDIEANYTRLRDILGPLEFNATGILLNDTAEGTSPHTSWITYRTVATPRPSGLVYENVPDLSLWHIQNPGFNSAHSWVAGTAPLGSHLIRMNDSLVTPVIDLSGVDGTSGMTPQGRQMRPTGSSLVDGTTSAVAPPGTYVPERQYPYGLGIVNLTFDHRYNFGTLGLDGAVVEVQNLTKDGTWSSWRPLLHSPLDQTLGYQYSTGESFFDKTQDIKTLNKVQSLGTPGYTRTSTGAEGNWTSDRFDLSDYVGQAIRLRFRVATRDFGFNTSDVNEFPEQRFFGWWVDNLHLQAKVRTLDAALTSVLSPRPGDVLVPDTFVNVTALVSNVGASRIQSALVRLTVNGTILAETDVSLDPGQVREVTIPWRVPPGVSAYRLNVSVVTRIGTEQTFLPTGDMHAGNDFVVLDVKARRVSDASLVDGTLLVVPVVADESFPRTITATLENVGNVPLGNLSVGITIVDTLTGAVQEAPRLVRVGDEMRNGSTAHVALLPPSTRITSLGSAAGAPQLQWSWTPPGPGIYHVTLTLTGGDGADTEPGNNQLPRAGDRHLIRVRATPPSYLPALTFEDPTAPGSTLDVMGPVRPDTWRAAVPGRDDPGAGPTYYRSVSGGSTPSRLAVAQVTLPAVMAGESLVLTFLSREDNFTRTVTAEDGSPYDVGRVELYTGRDAPTADPNIERPSPWEVLGGDNPNQSPIRFGGGGGGAFILASYVNDGSLGWQSRAIDLTSFAGRTVYLVFNHSKAVHVNRDDPTAAAPATSWLLDDLRVTRHNATTGATALWPPAPTAANPNENGCAGTRSEWFLLFSPHWTCLTTTFPTQWTVQSDFKGPGSDNQYTLQWRPQLREDLYSPIVDLRNSSDPWLMFDQFVDLNRMPIITLYGGIIPYGPLAGARATVEIQALDPATGAWSGFNKIYPEGGYPAGNYGPTGCLAAPYDDEARGPYDDYRGISTRDDNAFTGRDGPWERVTFNLSAQPVFKTVSTHTQCPEPPVMESYVGKLVRFRLSVKGPAGVLAAADGRGWFIDNFAVRERYFANDVGIALETQGASEPIRVGTGGTEVGQGSSLLITTKVQNYGRYDQDGVPVRLVIENGTYDPVTGTFRDFAPPAQLIVAMPGLRDDVHTVTFSTPWVVPACDACEGRTYRILVSTDLEGSPVKPSRDDDPSNDRMSITVRTVTRNDLAITQSKVDVVKAEAGIPRTFTLSVRNQGNIDAYDPSGAINLTLRVTRAGTPEGVAVPIEPKVRVLADTQRIAFGRTTTVIIELSDLETKDLETGIYLVTVTLSNPGDMAPANNVAYLVFQVVESAASWTLGPDDLLAGWLAGGRWTLDAGGLDGLGAGRYEDPAAGSRGESILESPPVHVGNVSRAFISLTHNFSFERGFDGGILEVSLGNGIGPGSRWSPWVAVTPQEGYTGTVASGTPFGPQSFAAFTGSSAALGPGRWVNSTFEVSGPGLEERIVLYQDAFETASTGWTVRAPPRFTSPEGNASYSGSTPNPNTGNRTLTFTLDPTKLGADRTLTFRDWREIEYIGAWGTYVSSSSTGADFNDRALVFVDHLDAACAPKRTLIPGLSTGPASSYADHYDTTWPVRSADLAPYVGACASSPTAPVSVSFVLNVTASGLAKNSGWALAGIRVGGAAIDNVTQATSSDWTTVGTLAQPTTWRQLTLADNKILGMTKGSSEGAWAFLNDAEIRRTDTLSPDVQLGKAHRNAEGWLESPVVDLSTLVGSAELVLRHKYFFENTRDVYKEFLNNGGRVEIRYVDHRGVTRVETLTPVTGYPGSLFATADSARDGTLGSPFNASHGVFNGPAGSAARQDAKNGWIVDRFDLTPYKGYSNVQILLHAWHGGNPVLDGDVGRYGWIVGDMRIEASAFSANYLKLRLRALTDATVGGNTWEVDTLRVLTELYGSEVSLVLDPALDGAEVRQGNLPRTPFTEDAAVRDIANALGFEVANRGRANATVRVDMTLTFGDGNAPVTFTRDYKLATGESLRDAFSWSPPAPADLATPVTIRARAYQVDDTRPDHILTDNERTARLLLHPSPVTKVDLTRLATPAAGIAGLVPTEMPIEVSAAITGTDPAVADIAIRITNSTGYVYTGTAQTFLGWPAGTGVATHVWPIPEGATGVYTIEATLRSPATPGEPEVLVKRLELGARAVAFEDDFEPATQTDGRWTPSGWEYLKSENAHSGEYHWTSLRTQSPGNSLFTLEATTLERSNIPLDGVASPRLTFSTRYAIPAGSLGFGARVEVREMGSATWQPLSLNVPYAHRMPTLSDNNFQAYSGLPVFAGRTTSWTTLEADLAKQWNLQGEPVTYEGKTIEIRFLHLLAGVLPTGTWGFEVDDVRISSYDLTLTPDPQRLETTDGVTKRLAFRVTNTGGASDRIALTLEGSAAVPREWTYRFCATPLCDTLVDRVDVDLAPGETYEGNVSINMGLSPFPGLSNPTISVVASSAGDPNRRLTAPLDFMFDAGRHADLLVVEVVVGSDTVTLGGTIPVTVFVRNQGTATVPGGTVSVRLFDNNRPLDTIILTKDLVRDPHTLRETWAQASFLWHPEDAGLHTLRAVVNPDLRVPEFDYANNGLEVPGIPVTLPLQPDLSIASVTLLPESPLSGSLAEVTVILRNRGTVDATGVTLNVMAGAFTISGGDKVTLAPGEARPFVFTWRVLSGGNTLTVSATGDGNDANPSDNQAAKPLVIRDIAPRVEPADPAAALIAAGGQEATWRALVRNLGATADRFNLDLELPAGWTGRLDTTRVGPLANPENATVELRVRPPTDAAAGTYTLLLRASAQGAPEASFTLPVTLTVPATRGLSLEPLPAAASPGSGNLLRVLLTNLGNAAERVALTSSTPGALPADLAPVLLAPYETRTVLVPVTLPAGTAPGPFALRLTAASAEAQASATAQLEVRRAYVASLNLTAGHELIPGKENVVTLTVRNTGNAEGVTLLRAVHPSGARVVIANGGDMVSVPAGESRTVTLRMARASFGSGAPLLVEALSYEGAARVDPELSTTVTRSVLAVPVAQNLPDLRIVSVDQDPRFNVKPGQTVTYTVVVENVGTADAPAFTAGLFMDSLLVKEAQAPAIPAGGRATLTLASVATEGSHFATVLLDIGDVVPEPRKEDNALAMKLTAETETGGGLGAATGKEVPAPSALVALLLAALALTGARGASRRRQP